MKNLFSIVGAVLLIILINSCNKDRIVPPLITTKSVTEISYTTATSGGDVTNEGGATIISKGVCWSTSATPTIGDNKTSEGGGLGTFTSNLTQLTQNTLYYVRAFATNSAGTGYGNQVTFTTGQISVPVLMTTGITSITMTTAISGGNISADNGGSVTARGVCWGTVTNPTTADSKTTDGTDKGSFVSNLTGLHGNTTYYVRAYATNTSGTGYGSSISFTTPGDKPAVTGASVINLGVNTATLSCSVNPNFMNTTVMFEWGTTTSYGNSAAASQNSLTGGNLVNASTNLTGLQSEKTYNFRIKATNDLGIVYSDNYEFKTFAVVDADRNGYYSITIGTQVWLTQDLKTTKYKDGTSIPNVTDATEWGSLVTGAYCNYNNSNDENLIRTYGRLYNWYSIKTGMLAPEGWHVPTRDEFYALINYLGGESVAGGKLKEPGTSHWLDPNTEASNESGFTSLPSGYRGSQGYPFQSMGTGVGYWTSYDPGIYNTYVNAVVLKYNYATAQMYSFTRPYGLVVRLIKD